MKKNVICSLDIGNSSIRAVVAKYNKTNIQVVAAETLPVRGIERGVVKDLAGLSDSIQEILNKIKISSRARIKRILVSINGSYVQAYYGSVSMGLGEKINHYITVSDINYLKSQVKLLNLKIDEDLLHEFEQEYILDDTHSVSCPLGLLARKIKLNSYILSALHTPVGNISSAVEQAGYEVREMFLGGVSSSFSVLSKEEKEKGVLLIDMGTFFTNFLFFKDNILRDFKMISQGGNDFTSAISRGLDLPWRLSEDIKKSSLIVSSSERKDNDKIVIKRENFYQSIERKALNDAVEATLEEFINQIKGALDSSLWKNKIEKGIVVVGGTAKIEGLLERIEDNLKIPVKLGGLRDNVSSMSTHFSSDFRMNLQYASALGSIYYALTYKNYNELNDYYKGRSVWERMSNFLKQLYLEYF